MSGSSSTGAQPRIVTEAVEAPTSMDDSQQAFSPAASDVGSLASHVNASHRYAGTSLSAAGMSSFNLAFPAQSSGGGQAISGFNAISAVLNNPHRPSRPIDPSSSRYPAVSASHTELPKVKRSDFDAYLNSVRPEWDRLERNRRMGQSGRARLDAEDKANALAAAAAAEDGEAVVKGRVSIEEARSMATGKRRLPPLSAVPQIFFSEDFDMGNPYTFDLVTERYKSVEGVDAISAATNEGGVYDVALNQMLQEKLSYYSDVVEQHLILEISARSSSFFAALGNLQDLEAEAASCLTRVEALQQELQRRDEKEAKAGLRIIREQAQRRELSERQAAVQAVRELVERRDLARLLVQSGQWDEALDVVGSLRDMLDGTTSAAATSALPAHLELEFSAVPSIAAMQPQLRELSDTIAVQLQGELLGVLAADLSERIGSPSEQQQVETDTSAIEVRAETREEAIHGRAAKPNSASAASASTINFTLADTKLAERITPLIVGLVRTGGVETFVDAHRKTALRGIRQATRSFLTFDTTTSDEAELEHLSALIEDDELASGKSDAKAVPGGAAAASRLREITHERFLALLSGLLDGFTRVSRAIEAHTRVVLKVLDDLASLEEVDGQVEALRMPEGVTPALPLILASVLQDATSLAHILGSRLLSLRAAAHVKLPLHDFLDLFSVAWGYVLRSEVLAGRMIVGLRGAILNQAKSWLAAFHRTRIEDAAKKVEEEMWGQAEVTKTDQEEVRLIVESATGDPAALVLLTDDGRAAVKASDENSGAATEEAQTTKTLEIEDRQYYVVGASLHVLCLLGEYLRVVINLPLLTTEAMGRVVEFLKQFNSRTCQVVLGAGAMRSAGLKNITAKHLALASQSLSIVITLIPYVRETVRRHLSATQAVMLIEFDKLRRDYQEHQYEIHAKLVAIMSDRLTVHCRALSNLDLNAPLLGSPPEPSKPITDLVKETATLHKVLYKYLHESSVENVMGQVLTSIDKRLAAEIGQTDVRGSEARERLAEDKALLDKKLGTLKSVQWKPTELEAALAEKQKTAAVPLPSSPVPSESATPAPYKARLPFLARRTGPSATHSPSGTNGRTSFDSTPGTPPLVSRPSFDSRRSMDRPTSEREAKASSARVAGAGPLNEEPEAEGERSDVPPQLPTKDELRSSAGEAPSSPSEPTPAEVSASTSSAPSVATLDGPAIFTGPNLKIDPRAVELPTSTPPTPRVESPIPPTPTTADSTAAPVTSPAGGAAPATPAKPARMTLQQRLAEAAKKRAAAAGSAKVEVENTKQEEQPTQVEESSGEKKSEESVAPIAGAASAAKPPEATVAGAEPSVTVDEVESVPPPAVTSSSDEAALAQAKPEVDAPVANASEVTTEKEASSSTASSTVAPPADAAPEDAITENSPTSVAAPEAVGLDVEVAAEKVSETSLPEAAATESTAPDSEAVTNAATQEETTS